MRGMRGGEIVRVTADAKEVTRGRILRAAQELFGRVGFEAATTREIAVAARIATGTLFNYFPTKEAIAVALAAEVMAHAHSEFESQGRGESLAEDLFALIAVELRRLKPHRAFMRTVLESALSPMVQSALSPEGESIRLGHLAVAERLIAERYPNAVSSPVVMSLYWTLYTGVLAFWAGDASPGQEDTLAVIDHYLKAFAGSLAGQE
jgi:AcrR family transcriptional regulator